MVVFLGVALVVGYWFGFVALWFACCLFYCFGVGGDLFLWVCGVSGVGFRVLYLVGLWCWVWLLVFWLLVFVGLDLLLLFA